MESTVNCENLHLLHGSTVNCENLHLLHGSTVNCENLHLLHGSTVNCENLHLLHGSTVNCENELHRNFNIKWQTEIRKAYDCDIDSKLGSYLQVNPPLRTPVPQINLLEVERISITRFRTGSPNLLIGTGRYSYPRISRELRICLCGNRV